MVVTDNPVIWGTNIIMTAAMGAFRAFLHQFALREDGTPMVVSEGDGDREPHYMRILREMVESDASGASSVAIDARHLYDWSEDGEALYHQLINFPSEIIPIMDIVLIQEYDLLRQAGRATAGSAAPTGSSAAGGGSGGRRAVKARVFNLSAVHRMRDLEPADIDKLQAVRGMVTRTSAAIPDMKVAYYRCSNCGGGVEVEVDRGNVDEPGTCGSCGERRTMVLIHNRCAFADKQYVKLQETPESIPEGETPQTVLLYAFDDLVDAVVPGDRITVTGIFRALPVRPNPRQRANRAVFKTYLDVIHFSKTDKARLAAEDPTVAADDAGADGEFAVENREVYAAFTSADAVARRGRLATIATGPRGCPPPAATLGPSTVEREDVKKGVLLQLFGGCVKALGREGKIRGELNILLVGDPGVAKSQLLSYVHKVAARGIYTSGKGSSAVGLTASITKDPETGEPVLESGALVLSDRGVCCIDEFDKMSDTTRVILHEVMEQQTVSIAKAGITTTLNARTAVLAAANPRYGRYNRRADPDATVALMKNINLPAALLSRFDLLFLLLDEVDVDNDKALAAHVTYVHQNEAHPPLDFEPLTPTFIRQYVSIVKHIEPTVPRELASYVVEAFVDMRAREKARASATGGRSNLTPRVLLSMLRMAQALARLEMREVVHSKDIDEAIRLYNVSKASVMESDARDRPIDTDFVSRIWSLIREHAIAKRDTFVRMDVAEGLATGAGYNHRQLEEFLMEYESLGLIQVNATRTRIDFVMLDE